MTKAKLRKEREGLLRRVEQIDLQLADPAIIERAQPVRKRPRLRPLRVVTLDFLHDAGIMLYSQS